MGQNAMCGRQVIFLFYFLYRKFEIFYEGVMIYEIIFGNHPWAFEKFENSLFSYYENITNSFLEFPENNVDPLMIDLIGKMLKKTEIERISWEEIEEHKILKRNDIPAFLKI